MKNKMAFRYINLDIAFIGLNAASGLTALAASLMERVDPSIFLVAASVAILNLAKAYVMVTGKRKNKPH